MTYRFSDEEIEEIIDRNNIVDVISEYIELKRAGVNFKALCPFHTEKTPSFVVSPEKQIFHCFGCGEGGNVISFVMKYENLNFVEAVKLLADRVGISLEKKNTADDIKKRKEKERLYALNREAAIYFYRMLKKNKRAYNYVKSRGIDELTIKTFGLGYSKSDWNDLLNYLKNKNYTEEEIERVGLIIKRKDNKGYYDRFRDRVIFPILDVRGRVIGFGGRVLDDSQPKYLNSPDTPVFSKGYNLYGLNIAKKNSRGNRILLVEGYMDIIALYSQGIDYCVASLGTALTEQQAKLLKRYSNDLYICYDSDEAGQNAANKALDISKKVGLNAKVVLLPEGKDPDEYIKHHSKKSFELLIQNALNYIEYKIHFYKHKNNLNTLEGRVKFTKDIAQLLRKIESPIEVDAYLGKVSDETGISVEAIKREIFSRNNNRFKTTSTKDKYRINNYRNNNKDKIIPVEYKLEPGHLLAEKSLLKLVTSNKRIYNKVKDIFSPEDFSNKLYRSISEVIYQQYETNNKVIKEDLLNLLNQEELKEFNEIINLDLQIDSKDEDKAVEDYIKKINYFKLKIERDRIKKQIRELESKEEKGKGDVERFKEMCLKLIEIDKQLKMHQ
ncbi:DNA primase [Caldisalinibacter kiritimatiensis]|uniref:DNA primase n=1 Tax=Caldisalinibacter kiritimatiensis TaxID=1304284 RepID=R1CC58_9FIRM|nr:DNA primase [Caldisalinibacter kiritimatiensis]EOC99889.1 DNA primase [Caldisalinibacter kiritimatiensis]